MYYKCDTIGVITSSVRSLIKDLPYSCLLHPFCTVLPIYSSFCDWSIYSNLMILKCLQYRPFEFGSLNAFFWSFWWFAYCSKLLCFASPSTGMAPMRGIGLLRTNWCGTKLDFCSTKLLLGLFCGIYMEKEISL